MVQRKQTSSRDSGTRLWLSREYGLFFEVILVKGRRCTRTYVF